MKLRKFQIRGDSIKIIGICGSPRNGNTTWIMEKIFKEISTKGIESELILLRNLHLELCNGCLICEDTGECPINDDMKALYEKLSQCDRLLIGTPVYFDSVPALLKKFIDRLNPLCVKEKLSNKDLYLIVVGQLKGDEGKNSRKKVIDYFRNLCEIFKMTFRNSWDFSAKEAKEISKLKNIEKQCKKIRGEIYG